MDSKSTLGDRATFYADKISDSDEFSEPSVRVRLIATAESSAVECNDYTPSRAPASTGITDVNFRNLQQSLYSITKENESLKDQLSTLAELKAQGDSLEMQVSG